MALVRVKCSLLLTLPPSLKSYFLLESTATCYAVRLSITTIIYLP